MIRDLMPPLFQLMTGLGFMAFLAVNLMVRKTLTAAAYRVMSLAMVLVPAGILCLSFGTGQSSLGRLRQLQLDKVKIDRSFVMTIGEDKTAEHIVRAILEMCEGLGMTVVAEGIEELDQAETLRRYGCHAGQGYLFGKPRDCHHTMNYIRDFLTYTASNARSGVA